MTSEHTTAQGGLPGWLATLSICLAWPPIWLAAWLAGVVALLAHVAARPSGVENINVF